MLVNVEIFWNIIFKIFILMGVIFGPIPWQAAEIIGGLLSTESQSDRVTESHPRVPSIRVGEIFLCLISIYSLRSQGDKNKNQSKMYLRS